MKKLLLIIVAVTAATVFAGPKEPHSDFRQNEVGNKSQYQAQPVIRGECGRGGHGDARKDKPSKTERTLGIIGGIVGALFGAKSEPPPPPPPRTKTVVVQQPVVKQPTVPVVVTSSPVVVTPAAQPVPPPPPPKRVFNW